MGSGIGRGYASVAVVGDRIYTSGNSDSGQAITALSATDGQVIWSTPITSEAPQHDYQGSRTTPTVDGDLLYAVSSGGSIACLNTADGKVVWSRDFQEWNGKMMSGWGYSESPLVDGELVLCTPAVTKAWWSRSIRSQARPYGQPYYLLAATTRIAKAFN